MIFKRELFPLEKYFKDTDKIYAHISENRNPETLKEHLNLTLKYGEKIYTDKNLKNVFENFENIFLRNSSELKEIWEEMILNIFYMHDVGKANRNFQIEKMKNFYFKKNISAQGSKHSNISAVFYLNYFYEKIEKLCTKEKIKEESSQILFYFLILNSYIILRHHSKTENFIDEFYNKFFEEYKEKFYEKAEKYCSTMICRLEKEKILKEILEMDCFKPESKLWKNIFWKKDWDLINVYIYVKFIYSLLVSADFYATYEYNSGKEVEDFNLLTDIDRYIEDFQKTEIYKGIERHRETGNCFKKDNINYYRSEVFLETEKNLKKNLDKNIFFLEAPTGAGKTVTSINLALNLLKEKKELNKIFYIFPFNTLAEQTFDSLGEIFHKEDIGVINSVTPVKKEKKNNKEDENEEIDYEKSLLNRQFIHSPITLTTHVHFFNNLFGIDRESSFALSHLANSVVIIDEIQSYKNKIWKEIIIFLQKYAQILNIKIIIMSATLPNLSLMLNEKADISNLVADREKYFKNPIFKDRVKLNFKFLNEENEEEILNILEKKITEKYKNRDKKIVVEFIKKKSAFEFYKRISEKYLEIFQDIFLLTGDDNKFERKRIIDEVKNKNRKGIILIATQVIEAGVDIDMDIGFKNISILDAEEQFLGRINRSCKKKNCETYFFKLDSGNKIYREDERTSKNLTLENEEMREVLKNKNFEKFYNAVIKELEEESQRFREDNIEEFKERKLLHLNFKEICERMRLIDKNIETKLIFFSRNIEAEGKNICGDMVWKEFKNIFLNKEMSYAERRVKLSEIMEKVDLFSYNIPVELAEEISFNDSIGEDIIFIKNGEEFFTNGKFDREKLKVKSESEFIF